VKKLVLLSLALTNALMLDMQAGDVAAEPAAAGPAMPQEQPQQDERPQINKALLKAQCIRPTLQWLLSDETFDEFRDWDIERLQTMPPAWLSSYLIRQLNHFRPRILIDGILETTLRGYFRKVLSFNSAGNRLVAATPEGTEVWVLRDGQ
jgi:hypothetical protein